MFEYRVSHPPFIVCADPTCMMAFASAEEYQQHCTDMAAEDLGPGTSEEVRLARRGSAVLMKAVSLRRAEEAAAAASGKKKKKAPPSAGVAAGSRYAPVHSTPPADPPNQREHSAVDFAEFHVLLHSAVGLEGCRNFIVRKLGIGVLVNTLDCWAEIQKWRAGSIASEGFVKRALQIYECYLRPGGARPVAIDPDDGDPRDDFDDDQGPSWLERVNTKLDAIKNREYEGFFQARRHKFLMHRLLCLRGRLVQIWTDAYMLTSDIFDGLEYACFMALWRALWDPRDGMGIGEQYMRSREKARYDKMLTDFNTKAQAALLEDCRAARKNDIASWCVTFRQDELLMAQQALAVADVVLGLEVDRLTDRAAQVWCREKLFSLRHAEQSVHEEKMAVADEAVDFCMDDVLDHVFGFYVPRLLNTMLNFDEMVEGMMEYAGMLKHKKLKKLLEVTAAPVGHREDLTWFKESLAASIYEDAKEAPLDYMGCVRLIQRRIRGMLGRNKVRGIFIAVYAKKFDPEHGRFYYVNQWSGDLTWERPAFFAHLFPKIKW